MAVDDESDITFMLKVMLEQCGFSVDVFNDSQTALNNFKAGYYDLVLLDVQMPEMNGLELYQEINRLDKTVKVCFFTAHETFYYTLRKQFPNLRSECLITKPISFLDLIKRLDNELVG